MSIGPAKIADVFICFSLSCFNSMLIVFFFVSSPSFKGVETIILYSILHTSLLSFSLHISPRRPRVIAISTFSHSNHHMLLLTSKKLLCSHIRVASHRHLNKSGQWKTQYPCTPQVYRQRAM